MTMRKIAVTVEPDLLERVERLRARTHEPRSAVVSRALRLLLKEAERQERTDEYVAAYADRADVLADEEEVLRLASVALAAVPWDDE